MRTLITTITLLFILPVFGQNSNIQQIDALIASQVQEDHPGIAVGIIKDGNIIYEKYRGLSNLQHQVNCFAVDPILHQQQNSLLL